MIFAWCLSTVVHAADIDGDTSSEMVLVKMDYRSLYKPYLNEIDKKMKNGEIASDGTAGYTLYDVNGDGFLDLLVLVGKSIYGGGLFAYIYNGEEIRETGCIDL